MKEGDQVESIYKNDTRGSENLMHGIEKLDFSLVRFKEILHRNTRKSRCKKRNNQNIGKTS